MSDASYQMEYGLSVFAKGFNEAGIPCIVWDGIMLDLFGIGGGLPTLAFVVPDHQIEHAQKVIMDDRDKGGELYKQLPFRECSDEECLWSVSPHEFLPDAHFHLDKAGLLPGTNPKVDLPFHLFRQSRVLWALPALDERYLPPPFGDKDVFAQTISPHYVLSTDQSVCPPAKYETMPDGESVICLGACGIGVWPETFHPVLAPKPYLAAEAYVRIYIRHFWTDREFTVASNMKSLVEQHLRKPVEHKEHDLKKFHNFHEMNAILWRVSQPTLVKDPDDLGDVMEAAVYLDEQQTIQRINDGLEEIELNGGFDAELNATLLALLGLS